MASRTHTEGGQFLESLDKSIAKDLPRIGRSNRYRDYILECD